MSVDFACQKFFRTKNIGSDCVEISEKNRHAVQTVLIKLAVLVIAIP